MNFAIQGTEQLEKLARDLLSGGSKGKAIFRKGLRAGVKIVAARVKATFPRKSGAAAASVRVRAIKRTRGRLGMRVSLFAENKGFPYPMGLEGGTKNQPPGRRVRKVRSRGADGKVRTNEEESHAYNALTWHVQPQHNIRKAFEAVESQAQQAILDTWLALLEEAGK